LGADPEPIPQQSAFSNQLHGDLGASREVDLSDSATDTDDEEPIQAKQKELTNASAAAELSGFIFSHPFHCTFPGCGRAFTQRYEWARHEVSLHYPQKVWVCCGITDPTQISFNECMMQAIIDWHGLNRTLRQLFGMFFSKCATKTEAERTFFRKDHLVQHIKTSHINLSRPTGMESSVTMPALVRKALPDLWEKSKVYSSKQAAGLHCSACNLDFKTWNERRIHFAAHFREGIFIWTRPDLASRRGALFVPPLGSLPHQNSLYL
jgi:hypothetical protein